MESFQTSSELLSKLVILVSQSNEKLGKLDAIEQKLGKLDAIEQKLGKLDAIEQKLSDIFRQLNIDIDYLERSFTQLLKLQTSNLSDTVHQLGRIQTENLLALLKELLAKDQKDKNEILAGQKQVLDRIETIFEEIKQIAQTS
jgi:hypothetical protein